MSLGTGTPAGGTAVLSASPDELRRAARLLRGVGAQMQSAAQVASRQARVEQYWQGLAATAFVARTEVLADVARKVVDPAQVAADLLEQFARGTEDAQAQVRTWSKVVAEHTQELTTLRGLGPPAEPALLETWCRRVAELEQGIERARGLIRRAEEEFAQGQQLAAGAIRELWEPVGRTIDQVVFAVQLGTSVFKGVTRSRSAIWSTRTVLDWMRSRWGATRTHRAAALERFQEAMRRFEKPNKLAAKVPRWFRAPGGIIGGPVLSAYQMWGAWQDMQDGGGYDGWRGRTTRTLAGAALVGVPLTYTTPLFPPVGLVAIGTVSTYQAWMAGNWVYDHRTQIVQAGRSVLERAPAVRRTVDRAATRALVGAVGRAQRFFSEAGHLQRQAQERLAYGRGTVLETVRHPLGSLRRQVEVVVDRLPDSGAVRESLRQLGEPIRMPDVPLCVVERLPVGVAVPWLGGGRWIDPVLDGLDRRFGSPGGPDCPVDRPPLRRPGRPPFEVPIRPPYTPPILGLP